MIFGRSVVAWVIVVVVMACVFVIAKWLIGLLFAAIGINIPPYVAGALALLIAVGSGWGSLSYRGRPA